MGAQTQGAVDEKRGFDYAVVRVCGEKASLSSDLGTKEIADHSGTNLAAEITFNIYDDAVSEDDITVYTVQLAVEF